MRWQLSKKAVEGRGRREAVVAPLEKLDDLLKQPELDDRGVHRVRQLLKQVRARLRLLQHELPERRYENARSATRQLAHDFSAAREYTVLRATLCQLMDHPEEQAMRQRILQVMQAHTDHELPPRQRLIDDQQRLKLALSAAQQQVEVTPPAMEKGLARSYRRCRKQWQAIRRWPDRESLHRWRRSVKQLQYQLQLLVPGQHERYQARVRQLGKLLGELHDLHDLELWQVQCARWLWLEERLHIQQLIRQRESELMAQIMALGKRLYRRRPSAFCRWQPAG